MPAVGTRVVAILSASASEKVVKYFGYGTYAGDFPVDVAVGFNFGQPNPRIDLDGGAAVWGCECWWGDAKRAEMSFPEAQGWVWEKVDILAYRQRVAKEGR